MIWRYVQIHQNGAVSVGNVSLNASLDVNGNLTIGDSSGASDGTTTTYQLSSGMDIDGALTINTGNTLNAGVNTITSSGDWTNNGTLDVDGDLFVSSGYLNLNGNQLNFGSSSADSLSISGDVIINDDAILQMAVGTRVVVESGGTLQIQGTSTTSRPQVTNQGSGSYSMGRIQ